VKPLSSLTGVIDEIKLRASLGQSGNRPNFGTRNQLLASGGIIGGQNSIVQPSTVGNPAIKPEVMHETEFGLDATLFKQRAALEFTHYARVITDLLLNAPLTPSAGLSTALINGGQLSVRGNEIGLTLVPILKRDFEWTFRTTYQANIEHTDYLPIPAFASGVGFGVAWGRSRIQAGQKSSLIWGNIPYSCVNTTNSSGQVVAGTGSDGKPCHALAIGQVLTGSVVRDTILGDANTRGSTQFQNQFKWKNWGATVLVDWRNGGFMSDMTNTAFDQGGNARDYADPSAVTGVTLGALRYGAWTAGDARPYVQDGTSVKLREVTLRYDAPKGWADLARARSMRFSLSGRNLAMYSKYWCYDSEFNNAGNSGVGRFVDLAPYPSSRQFSLSIDLGY
jgi:hypothetical protein